MSIPIVEAWIKQTDNFSGLNRGIDTCDITLILIVAAKTGPCEVWQCRRPAMFLRDHMIDVKH